MSTSTLKRPKRNRAQRRKERFGDSGVHPAVKLANRKAPAASVPGHGPLREIKYPRVLQLADMKWSVIGWMVLMHAGAIAAPFFFTWSALGVALALHWFTVSIGIGLCFHRYLAHRSFKLTPPAEFLAMLAGTLAGQGSPLYWAATHRVHHALSDHEGDPHSPRDGGIWSHLLWMFAAKRTVDREVLFKKYIPDLANRPIMRFLDTWYGPILFLSGGVLYAIGGLPWLLWGLCLRITVAYHGTWLVNSATHIWGYKTYTTTDDSKNNWWVAILTYGEGWHNNHHAHPSMAKTGHQWWEYDLTWSTIKLLKTLGLAWNVNDRLPDVGRREKAKGARASNSIAA
jgi:stearoyl-CoA desaturase (delta-9 desaturase)